MNQINVILFYFFYLFNAHFAFDEQQSNEYNGSAFQIWGPIPVPKGLLKMDGKNVIKTYETNAALKVDENDPLNNLVGIAKNGSFKSISRGIKQIKTQVLETCGKELFPHGIFIDWMTKIPKMYCEPHRCLNPAKIECQKNVKMHECSSSFQWISGFMKNQNHEIVVECCQNTKMNNSMFVKNVNITERDYWIHEIAVENEQLVAIDFFNNIRKIYKSHYGLIYTASVYRMKCNLDDN